MFKAVIILAIVAIFLLLALIGRGLVLMRRNNDLPGIDDDEN